MRDQQYLHRKILVLRELPLTKKEAIQVFIVGVILRQTLGKGSPRHLLEKIASRERLCVYIMHAYRSVGLSVDEYVPELLILLILERTYRVVKEWETMDIFLNTTDVADLIEGRLAGYFLAQHQLHA